MANIAHLLALIFPYELVLCNNNDKSIIAKARPLLDNDNALYIISIIM